MAAARLLCALALLLVPAQGFRVSRSWTQQHWCDSLEEAHYPLAVEKYAGQAVELKGRSNSNRQDLRHECDRRGVQSKCHRCEDIACGADLSETCHAQLQGVAWANMSLNVPTATDSPWAVGGAHRFDFGSADMTHVCVMLSGGACMDPFGTDYSGCSVRCWGHGETAPPEPAWHFALDEEDPLARNAHASDRWEYPRAKGDVAAFNPQGYTEHLAGSGEAGFADGAAAEARFNGPQDLAVDRDGNVFVADTENNRIRMVAAADGTVTTVAGTGAEGADDGAAAAATFSRPSSVALYYDDADALVVLVADTENHRVRALRVADGWVECVAGRCGNSTLSPRHFSLPASPEPGYADGLGDVARFDTPLGVAVDPDTLTAFVADSGNYLVRAIDLRTSNVTTVAGNLQPRDDGPGCESPCLEGVRGSRDGNLTYAQFYSLTDVTLGPNSTLLVTDEHRVRRVTYPDVWSTFTAVDSRDRVVTVAGQGQGGHGVADGKGDEAAFNQPEGLVLADDGAVYVADTANCRLRRLQHAALVAPAVACDASAAQLVRPSGCRSYDPPVDELDYTATPRVGNVYLNFDYRHVSTSSAGADVVGRSVKDCHGSPPVDALQTRAAEFANLVIDDGRLDDNEDTGDGTTIEVLCPPGCGGGAESVWGTDLYDDASSVCAAAVHAGALPASGGLATVTLQRAVRVRASDGNATQRAGSARNGVTSLAMDGDPQRVFSVVTTPQTDVEVQTIAGAPSAHLERAACRWNDSQPAQEATFARPAGVDALGDFVYVADTGGNVIRRVSPVCSQPCENGGMCTGTETCSCPANWGGVDCTEPQCPSGCAGARELCVGPDECACVPGYTGADCDEPLCAQECAHGACVAPDTCGCDYGWFDANCTTPVCAQTCGNGGNCTAPDTCSCPSEWTGVDCRTPVCKQTCQNGGACTAPDTCTCPPAWSGFDCRYPVCSQGFFVPDPVGYQQGLLLDAEAEPWWWSQYVPCEPQDWCNSTNGFDCAQQHRNLTELAVLHGPAHRNETGWLEAPPGCLFIELGEDMVHPYQLLREDNSSTPFRRYSELTPYGWDADPKHAWSAFDGPADGKTQPWTWELDRQVALVKRVDVVQGVYGCANLGNCSAPGVCQCAPGWMGFDCRTPVCSQGYHFPDQTNFVSGQEFPEEIEIFEPFLQGDPDFRLPWPYSNPNYTEVHEAFAEFNSDGAPIRVDRFDVPLGNERYLAAMGGRQGGYRCSIRSWTAWENVDFVFEHPNYWSRYMDTKLEKDEIVYTTWEGMNWPPVHFKSFPLGDNTTEGWRRDGNWFRVTGDTCETVATALRSHVEDDALSEALFGDKLLCWVDLDDAEWEYGTCVLEFDRVCDESPSKDFDLHSRQFGTWTQDPDLSYRERVSYSDWNATSEGRWWAPGGECVDQVVRGCFNNGTCVAPDVCECAEGWSGHDCSVPLCDNDCNHNGNCTLPNTCTCEKGWTGDECETALCAQDCNNGGSCVAPDTCLCVQWESEFVDGHDPPQPVFQKPDSNAQNTGYTGYDCNTPICTQAEAFVLNVDADVDEVTELAGHDKDGLAECDLVRCPLFDEMVVANDGHSFQTGCTAMNPVPYNSTTSRKSDTHLCGVIEWEQGDYIDDAGLGDTTGVNSEYGLDIGRHVRINDPNIQTPEAGTWEFGDILRGEGVYACPNGGSCIGPDLCTCADGWAGYDCREPMCRHLQPSGHVSSCQNDGICQGRDDCLCIRSQSKLHDFFERAPIGETGFSGSDCTMPMCVQGYYDPLCTDLPEAPSGEGCFRCMNGGNCTAPDVCTCADGWGGFDCSEPVCEVAATQLMRDQLATDDEEKVTFFETDPCGLTNITNPDSAFGAQLSRGNCTLPNQCTCLCKDIYDPDSCINDGEECRGPWQDPLVDSRTVLGVSDMFGTRSCASGYEGIVDEKDRFTTCHLSIFEPSWLQRYSRWVMAGSIIFGLFSIIGYVLFRRHMRQKYLLAKAQRRLSRRSSEELKAPAFGHN